MEEKRGKGKNAVGSGCYDCLVHIRVRFFGFVVSAGSENFRRETLFGICLEKMGTFQTTDASYGG